MKQSIRALAYLLILLTVLSFASCGDAADNAGSSSDLVHSNDVGSDLPKPSAWWTEIPLDEGAEYFQVTLTPDELRGFANGETISDDALASIKEEHRLPETFTAENVSRLLQEIGEEEFVLPSGEGWVCTTVQWSASPDSDEAALHYSFENDAGDEILLGVDSDADRPTTPGQYLKTFATTFPDKYLAPEPLFTSSLEDGSVFYCLSFLNSINNCLFTEKSCFGVNLNVNGSSDEKAATVKGFFEGAKIVSLSEMLSLSS